MRALAACARPSSPPSRHRRGRRRTVTRAASPLSSLAPPKVARTALVTTASAPPPPLSPLARMNPYAALGALTMTSVAMTTATLVTVVAPTLRAVERACASMDAAAVAAERAALEVEALSRATLAELPATLDAMETSANEVELLAQETREALTRLDAFNVDALVNEFRTKIGDLPDPARDIANLSDDASEYVRRLSMELGLVMQSVGALTSGDFDDAFDVGLTQEEKNERKNAIADAVQVARETTERAKLLTTQLQNPSSGRDIAEVVGKIEQSSRDVSTAMRNALRVFETVGVVVSPVVPPLSDKRELPRRRTQTIDDDGDDDGDGDGNGDA